MIYEPIVEHQLNCPNCGTKFNEAATATSSSRVATNWEVSTMICAVCHYDLTETATKELTQPQSSAELENLVHDLLLGARTSGVDPAEIVQVLRDELEFAAELAGTGRRFSVQVIDLGPEEQSGGIQLALNNNRDLINSRSFEL